MIIASCVADQNANMAGAVIAPAISWLSGINDLVAVHRAEANRYVGCHVLP